jgi:anti-sigma regulatory factor (Ser/Thr protein kinase)
MRRVLDSLGFDTDLRNQLVLAVDEAAANVIRHGYKNAPDGKLELSAWLVDENLEIRLRDFAPPVDASCVKPRDLMECKPGGLGVNLIDMSFDRWWFAKPDHGCGNVLVMTRRLPF